MISIYNELTDMDETTQASPVDSAQHYFVSGFIEAASQVKQRIVELREQTLEPDTIAKLDELYAFCKTLDKSALHFMPTVIAHKK